MNGPTGMLSAGACDDGEHLDLNELFPSFSQPPDDTAPHLYRNISIDVEKIDMSKFKQAMNSEFEKTLNEEKNQNEESKKNHVEDGRRYAIKLDIYRYGKFHRGLNMATDFVGIDIILQLLYMAKKQMNTVEGSKFFNTKNIAYRAGFLGTQMKKNFSKLTKIYTYMRKYAYSFYEMRGHIVLHHRSVKIHVDMLYVHWVMTVLDGIYRDRKGAESKPKLISSEKPTGGITIEHQDNDILKDGFLINTVQSGNIPRSHVPVLEYLTSKYMNTTRTSQSTIVDLLFGDGSAEGDLDSLDVNHLNHASLKTLIDAAVSRHNNATLEKLIKETEASQHNNTALEKLIKDTEASQHNNTTLKQLIKDTEASQHNNATLSSLGDSRRSRTNSQPHLVLRNEKDTYLINKLFDMMKQSIYAVRYRLAETRLLRVKFRENTAYNIGIIVSNVYQILIKSYHQLDHAYRLPENTFMLWHLIYYEKMLANSIDVENLVQRAFMYNLQSRVLEMANADGGSDAMKNVTFPPGRPTADYAPQYLQRPDQ